MYILVKICAFCSLAQTACDLLDGLHHRDELDPYNLILLCQLMYLKLLLGTEASAQCLTASYVITLNVLFTALWRVAIKGMKVLFSVTYSNPEHHSGSLHSQMQIGVFNDSMTEVQYFVIHSGLRMLRRIVETPWPF